MLIQASVCWQEHDRNASVTFAQPKCEAKERRFTNRRRGRFVNRRSLMGSTGQTDGAPGARSQSARSSLRRKRLAQGRTRAREAAEKIRERQSRIAL